MSEMVRRLMGQQRNRLVGTMMTSVESRDWWGKLNANEKRAFKDDLQRSVGVYHDFMLDVVKVGGDDDLRSDQTVALLQRIERGVATLTVGGDAKP